MWATVLRGDDPERPHVQPDDLPVRRHRRSPDEGRAEQHRVPERRGRRARRGDREADAARPARRELRTDSGGAGGFRGGLGQATEMSCRSGRLWSVSTLIDRTRFVPPGLEGGESELRASPPVASGAPAQPKSVLRLDPDERVRLFAARRLGLRRPAPARRRARARRRRRRLRLTGGGPGGLRRRDRVRRPAHRLVRTPDLYRVDQAATDLARAEDVIAG